uniref:ESF1 homolog isoform X2 n=1 Tax=Ciona intestinalis TaxID=7719 RepID=UPI0000521DA5|nr:ESF1 homolog isoform X2 [Ciona intestinalis]|eukprot:XP_009860241.1 ESF1 homolog isoform X2 [Ciona intestinalis]
MPSNDTDKRFESVLRDHRFRSIKQKQKKVQIDGRFQSMFTDKRFKLQYETDKRGKPIHQASSENLKKYYRLSYEEKKRLKAERARKLNCLNSSQSETTETTKVDETENESKEEKAEDSSEYESSDEDEEDPDLARGEGGVETSSDEEEDEFYEDQTNIQDQHWGEMDADADRSTDISSRLALCNMDWDRIRATDLFVLFDSFKPVNGKIKSVSIYPSEYGLQRLAEEVQRGPAELRKDDSDEDTEDKDVKILNNKEGSKFQAEKLRQYQINRLKYYYAVIECDSKETADALYQDCDGLEYETSSTKLDLRFIPDETTFDEHPPKDMANSLPDKELFKPSEFITKALNQAKVDLTWDETDHRRLAVTMRRFNEDEIADMDVKDFLASSSGSDEEENETKPKHFGISSRTTDEDQIMRYRSLLLDNDDADDKKDDVDMEVTWEPDLLSKPDVEEEGSENEEKENEDKESEEDSVDAEEPSLKSKKKKFGKKRDQEETEDDRKRKAELEMLMLDEEDLKKHFNMDEIEKQEQRSKKSKKRHQNDDQKEDNFKIDVDDRRFSALYTTPAFALDPNNPSFRKTKAMKELLNERQTRVQKKNEEEHFTSKEIPTSEETVLKSTDSSIPSLVNAIKAKTKSRFAKKKTIGLLNKKKN